MGSYDAFSLRASILFSCVWTPSYFTQLIIIMSMLYCKMQQERSNESRIMINIACGVCTLSVLTMTSGKNSLSSCGREVGRFSIVVPAEPANLRQGMPEARALTARFTSPVSMTCMPSTYQMITYLFVQRDKKLQSNNSGDEDTSA